MRRNHPSNRPPAFARAAGFTLIEVLVAMLVLAVGMLGIAAMQLRGLQYNHDAYLRSQISILAYDISDRMRLNRDTLLPFVGSYTVTTSLPTGCDNSASTAANDILCWRTRVAESLPPASVATIAANGGGEYTVTVTWKERDAALPDRVIDYTFQP